MTIPDEIKNLVMNATPPTNTKILWYDTTEKHLKAFKTGLWHRVHHLEIQTHHVKRIFKNTTKVFDDGFEIIKAGHLNYEAITRAASLLHSARHTLMASKVISVTGGEAYHVVLSGPTPNTDASAKIRIDGWTNTATPVAVETDPSQTTPGDIFHEEQAITSDDDAKDRMSITFTAPTTGDIKLTIVGDDIIDPLSFKVFSSTTDDPASKAIEILHQFKINRTEPGTITWTTEEPVHTLHFFHKTQTVSHVKADPFNPAAPNADIPAGKWYLITGNAGVPMTLNGTARIAAVSTIFAALGKPANCKIRVEVLPDGMAPTEGDPGKNAVAVVSSAPNHDYSHATTGVTSVTHIAARREAAVEDWITVNHAGKVNAFIWIKCDSPVQVIDPYTALIAEGQSDQHPTVLDVPTFIAPVQMDIEKWHHGGVHVIYANETKQLHADINVMVVEDKGGVPQYTRTYVFQNPFDVTIDPALGHEITSVSIDGEQPVLTGKPPPPPAKPPVVPGTPKASFDLNFLLSGWTIDHLGANIWFIVHSHTLPFQLSATNVHVPVSATGIHETTLADGSVAFAFETNQPYSQQVYMLVAKAHRWWLVSPPIPFNNGPGLPLSANPFLGAYGDFDVSHFTPGDLAAENQDAGFSLHLHSGLLSALPLWGGVHNYNMKANAKLPPGMKWEDLRGDYFGAVPDKINP
jgi:hypothetical protein